MKYNLKVSCIHKMGHRVNQEDFIYPADGQCNENNRLFVLCDGMGGHEAGEVASETVCNEMSRWVNDHCEAEGIFTDDDFEKALSAAFDALDTKEPDDKPQNKKMGTTMTFLKLHEQGATIAHIGDSRVYHIRPSEDYDKRILHVTEDHSLVNNFIRIGRLTPEKAWHSQDKCILTRAMQPNMKQRVNAVLYHTSDIMAGDYFYLCSDGMLEQEEYDNRCIRHNFAEANGDDGLLIEKLLANEANIQDNHSAIIVHILSVIGKPQERRGDSVRRIIERIFSSKLFD